MPAALAARALPGWLRHYRRASLGHDVVAGLIVWSVVVPQAVAYAQIAGLPPEAGLVAAPGAMVAYALLGTSRSLVVSATTATSAISATAVGPLAHGDLARFAALSAALALATGAVLVAAGIVGIGGLTDLVSKPVMTGFLFGLALTVSVGQLPKMFGVSGGEGTFFEQLRHVLGELSDASGWTVAVGVISVLVLLAFRLRAPKLPGTLIVLVGAIVLSALLNLKGHGVSVVGHLPSAYPSPAWPDVSGQDVVDLLPAAFGMMLLTTEASAWPGRSARPTATTSTRTASWRRSAARTWSRASSGFVQSGGASQTMAAESAGGVTQLTSIVAAGLILLTGAFLAPLFRDLPQATLGAIVVVAISSFYRVDELRRFARLRRGAIVLALTALIGVLVFNILPGLLIAAGLSLILVIKRLAGRRSASSGATPRPARSGTSSATRAGSPSRACCSRGWTGRCSTPTRSTRSSSCSSSSRPPTRRRERWCSTSPARRTSTSRRSTAWPSSNRRSRRRASSCGWRRCGPGRASCSNAAAWPHGSASIPPSRRWRISRRERPRPPRRCATGWPRRSPTRRRAPRSTGRRRPASSRSGLPRRAR